MANPSLGPVLPNTYAYQQGEREDSFDSRRSLLFGFVEFAINPPREAYLSKNVNPLTLLGERGVSPLDLLWAAG
jgi:hypothetical protein